MKTGPRFIYDILRDVELWSLPGPDYEIPVFLRHGKLDSVPMAEIIPTSFLTRDQFDTVCAHLLPARHIKLAEGWAIYAADVRMVARKCPGITPRFYFRWRTKANPKKTRPKVSPDAPDAFIEHVA